jgi:hypothetical protein
MSARWSFKRWGWIMGIVAIALLGVGLWIGFPSAAGLLTGHPVPNFTCNSDKPVLLTPIAPIAYLTNDAQSLYWLTRGNPGAVMKMSKSSGKIQTLAQLGSDPGGILVEDESVFWVEGTWDPDPSFILKKVSKQGGEVTELWQAQGTMTQLSTDADYFYWLDYEAKAVLRMPKKGGETELLVSGLDDVSSIIDGKIFLGGNRLGILDTPGQSPRVLITIDELIPGFGSRPDERSIYAVGPIILEDEDKFIFEFYVAGNPGMVSCSDNASYITSVPEAGGTPEIIMTVEGALSLAAVFAPYIYTIGDCRGGGMVNVETGETAAINIGYDAFTLAVNQNHLYWSDREGLKCMQRPTP